jgi:hypothetical protein
VTTFSAPDEALEPTNLHFGSFPPPSPIALVRPARDRGSFVIFALAAAFTLLCGVTYSKYSAAPPAAAAAIEPAVFVASMPMSATAPVEAAPVPQPAALITAAPLVTTAPAATPSAPARRVVKARVAMPPAKAACVAKLDRVTGKTVYEGNCD